jgi:hypothetical protein
MPPPPFSPDLCKIRKKHDFPQKRSVSRELLKKKIARTKQMS